VAAEVESTWVAGVDGHVEPEMANSALLIIDTQADFVDGDPAGVGVAAHSVPASKSTRRTRGAAL